MRNVTKKSEPFVEVHQPCPCGKSSDAYAIRADNSGFCFSCGDSHSAQYKEKLLSDNFKTFLVESKYQKEIDKVITPDNPDDFLYDVIAHRGISVDTYKRYGTLFKLDKQTKEPLEIAFIYPKTALQLRRLDRKEFWTKGNMSEEGLYGIDKFDPGAYDSITICEGAFDAHAAFQMLDGDSACVAIKSAQSAKKDCIIDWEKINAFKKIIICVDNDEPGIKAAQDIASLFDFNKVFKVTLSQYKDANDYLINGKEVDFIKAWSSSKRYTPDNIIASFSDISSKLDDSQEDQIGTYPFKGLQEKLYGLHKGEVIVFKGDEGIGKTETFRAMQHHLLKTVKNCKIAIIHLEEDNGTTVKGIATYEDKYPYVHPENKASKKQILDSYMKAVEGKEDKVFIYESFDVEDEDIFLDNIRFLVSACGCQFVFLDHISWLGTGLASEDERKKLDRISQKLKLLAKELRFCMILISHTNDDGKTRGSRNISKAANTVIHMHRDKVAANEEERNKMLYIIEKARGGGNTGPGGFAMFEKDTMRLIDMEEAMQFEFTR